MSQKQMVMLVVAMVLAYYYLNQSHKFQHSNDLKTWCLSDYNRARANWNVCSGYYR